MYLLEREEVPDEITPLFLIVEENTEVCLLMLKSFVGFCVSYLSA